MKKISSADILLKKLVESFYGQHPKPPASISLKMSILNAVDYLKSKEIELPNYEKSVAEYQRLKGKNNNPDLEKAADRAMSQESIGSLLKDLEGED